MAGEAVLKENDITARVIKMMCTVPGCFARKKFSGRFQSGDPDIAGVINGWAFFVEAKVVGGELSRLQAAMLEQVAVVRCVCNRRRI